MANEMITQDEKEIQTAREMGVTTIQRATELARGINDATTLAVAADFLMEIKRRRKQWAEFNKPAKQKLDALKRELLDRERQIDEPLDRAENEILKPAMAKFQQEQEQIRRATEYRLREEARKREEDARLQEAQELNQNGQSQLAEAVLEAPVVVAPVVIPKMETPAGVSYRDVWKFEIVDPNAVPREYLIVDEKKIGGVVRAMKNETRIAGIRVYKETTVAGRI